VPQTGILPLARSFDTCGVFAADGALLRSAGRALLKSADLSVSPPDSLTLATDLVAEADVAVADAVRARAVALAAALGIELREGTLTGGRLSAWLRAFRGRQFVEAWQAHGDWLQSRRPALGPGVAERFAEARDTPLSAANAAESVGAEVLDALDRLLPPGGALVLPSAATVAPPPDLAADLKNDLRLRTMRLTCVAGLAGAPAVSIPTVTADERLPVGVCLVGRPGDDERLLAASFPTTL
jgi:amidase